MEDDSIQNCKIHPNNQLDRICVSNICQNLNQIICIECAENHNGRPTSISLILQKLKKICSDMLLNNPSDIILELSTIKSIQDRMDQVKSQLVSEIDRYTQEAVAYIEYSSKSYYSDIKSYTELNWQKLNQSPEIQEQLINLFLNQQDRILSDLSQVLLNFEQTMCNQWEKVLSEVKSLKFDNKLESFEKNPVNRLQFDWQIQEVLSSSNTQYQMIKLNENEILVSSDEDHISLIDVEKGIVKCKFKGITDWTVKDCMFQVNELVIGARSSDGNINIYNKVTFQLIQQINLQEVSADQYNNSCIFNTTHNLLVSSIKNGDKNYGVILFKFNEKNLQLDMHSKQIEGFHEDQLNNLYQFSENIILSSSEDYKIREWRLNDFKSEIILEEQQGILCIRKLNSSQFIYNHWDGSIVLYDYQLRKKIRTYKTGINKDPEDNATCIFTIDIYYNNMVLINKDFCQPSIQCLNLVTGEVEPICSKFYIEGSVYSIILRTIPRQLIVFTKDGLQKYTIK